MALNKSKGNMYSWITHTYNIIKGLCPHMCSYCYMHRWRNLKDIRFDEKELKTDLESGNFIFVGSSCDMWAKNIPKEWIEKVISKCMNFQNNYLFQSKNPKRFKEFKLPLNFHYCTTIETNRVYTEMGNTPDPMDRSFDIPNKSYITIEPIFDFDLIDFLTILRLANPIQINIGADSGNNNLPEPPKEKILELISELEKFTKVKLKTNLNRLIK